MQSKFNVTSFKTHLLCLTACISQQLYAETGSTEPVLLPEITIEAPRTNTTWLKTPASVYRVQQAENNNNTGVNLSETLKGVPGLQLNNRENYAQDLQLSMRGFGARSTFGVRGIRLYVDGIPATMPDGQGQTSNIDMSSLNHIEVLGGPFSSLYGNSSGGAILTTTKQGTGKDTIELGYSGGSHHKSRADIVLQGGSERANEPSYVVSSSYFETDGYRDHSAANKVLSNAKLTWDLDDGSKVNWIVNHVDINADDPQGLNREQLRQNLKQVNDANNTYDVRKEISQTQTGLTWKKPLNDQHELNAMVYMGQRNVTQYQSIPKCALKIGTKDCIPNTIQLNQRHAGGVIDFSRDYYGTDIRWTGKDLLPNTRFTAGLAFDYMDEDRKGYENFDANGNFGKKGNIRRNENNTLWNLDPYVQASWNFLPNWTLDTGLRYSNVHYESDDKYVVGLNKDDSGKTDYDKVLPSAAVSWNIAPQLNAYASYAKGFETPTFTEMAYSKDDGMNFDLKPASSNNYELGLKSRNAWGNFTAAVFQSKTQDDIVSAGTEEGRATYRNADKTLREGVELSWNKQLWRDLSAQASYSYIDATFDAFVPEIPNPTDPAKPKASSIRSGAKIPGIAKNQAFAALNWQPDIGFNAGLDVRYMDKVYVDDANSDAASSYTVVSANAGYVWKQADWKVKTYVRADNLFDENYVGSVIVNDGNGRFFEPADGVNWSAGLSVTKAF
ncbi:MULTISPECIES: TonB-dependent receptor [Acinetobacter]|uniref:TonB-dependent receptor n=1 Tax=Acinetobacter TaxID=469 RepID=UPI000992F008|nr:MULTISPECIES: TonB-dependent receptor [Acinetobacter]MCL6244769.1 TonB-dependent receptor [Acinetobacter amyesii]OOV84287.1 TonB-dependent siderophore receptor [Acinetobacter sp. ANC 5600]